MRFKYVKKGFALPSVVVASIILLGMLALALQLSTTADGALKDQYYNQLAREAAESGMKRLRRCMKDGERPVANQNYAVNATSCKNPAPNSSLSQYLYTDGKIGVRYDTSLSSPLSGLESNKITSIGYVDVMRPSGGVWKTVRYVNVTIVSELDLSAGGIAVLSSQRQAYVVRPDGVAWGWGYNNSQQLGAGSGDTYTPVRIIDNVKKIIGANEQGDSAGALATKFALRKDGSVWGWGQSFYNDPVQNRKYHLLGNRAHGNYPAVPIISGGVKDIFSVDSAIFAVKEDNSLWAWGRNENGMLGNGTENDAQPEPVRIMPASSSPVVKMLGGHSTMAALKADGTFWLWGMHTYYKSKVPVKLSIPPVEDVDGDNSDMTLLLRDGRVMGWRNLSNPWRTMTLPDYIGGLTNIKKIYNPNYAIDHNGALYAWNGLGILGDGIDRRPGKSGYGSVLSAPVKIIDSGVVDLWRNYYYQRNTHPAINTHISSTSYFALKSDGKLMGWGENQACEMLDTDRSSVVLRPKLIMNGVKKFYASKTARKNNAQFAAIMNNDDLMTWGHYPGDGSALAGQSHYFRCTPFRALGNVRDVYGIGASETGAYYAVDHNGNIWSWGNDGSVSSVAGTVNNPSPLGRGNSAKGNVPGLIQLPDWKLLY